MLKTQLKPLYNHMYKEYCWNLMYNIWLGTASLLSAVTSPPVEELNH